MAIVVVLSVFNGFSRLAESRLSLMDAQLLVERADGAIIADADSLAAALATIDGVASTMPTLSAQALAIYAERQMPVRLLGVTEGYAEATGLHDLVIEGEYIGPGDADPYAYATDDGRLVYAALSIGVAATITSPTGFNDYLRIYTPRRLGRVNPANPLGAFASDSVVVSSVFRVDRPEYDNDVVILPIDAVRALLDYDHQGSSIRVATDTTAVEATVQQALQAQLGPEWTVKNRMEQQEQSFRMIQVEKWISFLLLAFILIIASFNIISTLSILIIEKEANIATLRSIGASRSLIRRIFTTEGWLISTAGGVVGIVVGVALCLAQQWFGLIKLSGDPSQLVVDTYPVAVEPLDLLAVALLVALVGLLATGVTRRFLASRLA